MLQVFQKHVASIYSKCFICFQTSIAIFYYLDIALFHTCCSSMFQMFQLFESYVVASGFMLQACVLNVSSTFRRMLYSNVFYVASVLCCTAKGERTGRTECWGADGRSRWGRRTVVLRSGRARGMLVLRCTSRLLSAAPAKREEGVRGDRRAQRRGEGRQDQGKDGRGGCAGVRALATPFFYSI
jgi:hypothetical protein